MQAKTLVCWYLQTKTGLRLQAKLPFITAGENTEKNKSSTARPILTMPALPWYFLPFQNLPCTQQKL